MRVESITLTPARLTRFHFILPLHRSGASSLHRCVKVFTILLIGDGSGEIVDISTGGAVLMFGSVVCNVSSALLVGFLTVGLVDSARSLAAPS